MSVTVLHALVPAPVGGLERVVAMLANARHRRSGDVAVAAVVEPRQEAHPFFSPWSRLASP